MARFLKKLKYPKFLLLILTFALAYLLFNGKWFSPVRTFIPSLGYFGAFLAGIMFAYGFTAAPGTAIFLILAKTQNIYLAGLLGGLGALCADFLIFKFIRHSFKDEIEKLANEKIITHADRHLPKTIKRYLIPLLAGLIIASPLPDEIGVALFASTTKTSDILFSIISFALNTAGIFVILFIGMSI